jgi:hypothetical protein
MFHLPQNRSQRRPMKNPSSAEGLAAATLGEGPFTYTVELVLDGRRYVCHRHLAGRRDRRQRASVALHFTPSVPRLS